MKSKNQFNWINISVVRGAGTPNYSMIERNHSMNIYFKPTYLYIKQHNITGLKYFGKTVKLDVFKYKGSGKHWSRHLKKYGNDVTTVWHQLFHNKEELVEFATKFSIDNDIVNSPQWANLKIEDGLWGGGVKGIKLKPMSLEHKAKLSESVKNAYEKKGCKIKDRTPLVIKTKVKKVGWTWEKESKERHSLRQLGIPKRRMCCVHCKKEGSIANILQWHGDKCKMNPV